MKRIVMNVVAFDPIKILTCWALQNDSQKLSFVTAIYEVGEKLARNTSKWSNPSLVLFISKPSLSTKTIRG